MEQKIHKELASAHIKVKPSILHLVKMLAAKENTTMGDYIDTLITAEASKQNLKV